MRIAHVLYGEILAPVVRSQTFPLVRRLRERGHEVLLVALTSPRRLLAPKRYADAVAAAREAADGNLRLLTHSPRHLSYRGVARRLRRALRRFDPEVVHCRQSRATVAAGRAGPWPIVADLRGIRPEEYLLGLGRSESELGPSETRALARLRAEEREARAAAARIVCVSGPFREHLGGDARVAVIPNAGEERPAPGEEERAKLRAGLGFPGGAPVFVYSGSLAAWQCGADAVELFREIRERRPEARLALLTHDREAAEALVRAHGVADAVVRSLTPEETREILPAFDAAFLLREDHVVNLVAAPVKFGEYLHAGLPVILTRGIGDASEWVRSEGLGVVLPGPRDPGNADRVLEAFSTFDGERCRTFARARLSFSVTVPLYEAVYRAAAGGEVDP
jgi:glycosyltransferase involved in cell wall biosynthesis